MTTTETQTLVLHEVRDGVALLTLNRPDRANAWTAALEDRYFDLLEECADDPEVRAIVVTAAGKTFCPGFDMDELQAIGDGTQAAPEHRRPQTFPLSIPKPIVCAINGACAGIGLVQALMCDIRFAASGVKFTTAFSRRGLIAEHGSSWLLPRLVGPARALDLLLSARVVLAEEAQELGLVNAVLPAERLVEEAVAYAADLAANVSPASMAVIKQQVYAHMDAGLPEALEESNRFMVESFARPDVREGVTSYVERRAPRFEPLPPGVRLPR